MKSRFFLLLAVATLVLSTGLPVLAASKSEVVRIQVIDVAGIREGREREEEAVRAWKKKSTTERP